MLILGCDYHPGFQQIALVDTETGEVGARWLSHRDEAERFCRTFRGRNARVGNFSTAAVTTVTKGSIYAGKMNGGEGGI